MTIFDQLIQLKSRAVRATPEMRDLEQLPAFQTMCEVMRAAYKQPNLYTDEIATARHCLLQKEVANALTPNVILWLFNTYHGQRMMLMDSLPVCKVLETGFFEEELIAALWHYSSEFDSSKQEINLQQYVENTQRIMDAIRGATALSDENLTKYHDDDDWFGSFSSPPSIVLPTNRRTTHPLRIKVLMGDLSKEYGISILDLLKKNGVTIEALYRHNGFLDMKEPVENLYVDNLDALYALDDQQPPPIRSNEFLPEQQQFLPHSDVFTRREPSIKNATPDSLGKIIDVAADGNCFFHALVLGLAQKNITSLSHEKLRSEAVTYLRMRPEIMQCYSYEHEKPDDYLNRMSRPGIDAEGPIIEVTAIIMNIQLEIININTDREGKETTARFVINQGLDRMGTVTLIRLQEEQQGDPHPYQHYQVLESACTTRAGRSSNALAPTAPNGPPPPSYLSRIKIFKPEPKKSAQEHNLSPTP